jgi:hypothetical protein
MAAGWTTGSAGSGVGPEVVIRAGATWLGAGGVADASEASDASGSGWRAEGSAGSGYGSVGRSVVMVEGELLGRGCRVM